MCIYIYETILESIVYLYIYIIGLVFQDSGHVMVLNGGGTHKNGKYNGIYLQ